MTRVLVTGANGHVGADLVRSLIKKGYVVAPFVRPTSDLRGLTGLDLAYIYGDVQDGDSLMKAAEGCEAIIHCAAVYRTWAKDPDEIMQPAVAGTRNVFAAARQAGVKRLVYTSSIAAVGTSSNPSTLLSAGDWDDRAQLPYNIAKTRSEREAWKLADEYSLPMISLCPGFVLGRYDYRITPSMETIQGFLNGTGITAEGGFSYVDVRDVAEIHALAVEHGEPGQRYIVTAHNIRLRAMADRVNRETGINVRHLGGPRWVAGLFAGLMEAAARVTKRKPYLTRAVVNDVVQRYYWYDASPTWAAFGHEPIGMEEMLRDTISWLVFSGTLRQDVAAQLAPDFAPDEEWAGPDGAREGSVAAE